MNLSKYGGAYNGALIDSAVQEYNLKTGKLLRSWDALDHIPLSDSYATLPTNGFPWDAYHVNSIDLTGNGTFLVSMRNTWAAYLVNIDTGKIEWTLGGKHSSFKFGPGAAFQWQHDVQLQPGSTVSHVRRPLLPADRRRHLRPADRAIARARAQARPAGAHGDARWPSTAAAAASTPTTWATRSRCRTATCSSAGDRNRTSPSTASSGKLLLEGELPGPDLTYRATLEQWVGLPLSPPVGRRPPDGRQDDGVRELERRHPGRLLEGPGRRRRRPADRRGDRAPSPGSRRRSRCRRATRASRSRRSTPTAG